MRTLYTRDYVATLRSGVAELRAKGREEDGQWRRAGEIYRGWLFTAGVETRDGYA